MEESQAIPIPHNHFQFFATVTTGLEFIAEKEIKEKLSSNTYSSGKLMPGRVLFSISNQNDDTMKILLNLKSVEHLFVIVGVLQINKDDLIRETLLDIPKKFTTEQWNQAMSYWKAYMRLTKGIKNDQILSSPIFRVTSKIAGEHKITSVDFASTVAEGLVKHFPSWRSNTKSFEMEVFAYLRYSTLYFTIGLTDESLSLQQVDSNRSLGATPLRPAIAYCMLKMADLLPGEILVDPMCGCGTITEIAAFNFPSAFYLAGDIAEIAITKTTFNFTHTRAPFTDILRWDCRKLPFADNSVDAIVTDIPFGKRMGSRKSNKKLYPAILTEFARVVKSGTGRMIILTSEKQLLLSSVAKVFQIKIKEHHCINQGGLDTHVFHIIKQIPKVQRGEVQKTSSEQVSLKEEKEENQPALKKQKTEEDT